MSEPAHFFGDDDADALLTAYLARPLDWDLMQVLADRLEELACPDAAGWRWLADNQRHPATTLPGYRLECLWVAFPRFATFDRYQSSFFLPWEFFRHARADYSGDDNLYYYSRTAALAGAARAMVATPPPFGFPPVFPE